MAELILMGANIDGRKTKRLMTALDDAGDNLPLRRMRVIAERSVLRTISEGGRPKKWAPLAATTSSARRDVKKYDAAYEANAGGALHTSRRERAYFKGRAKRVGAHKLLMDSGRLRMSVQSQNIGRENFKVHSDVEYAGWQNFGTGTFGPAHRAYPILPTSKKALMWPGAGGAPVFSRGHMHPGIPARPFMVWQEEDIPALIAVVAEHMRRTARKP